MSIETWEGKWLPQVTLLAGCQAHFWDLGLLTRRTKGTFHCILRGSTAAIGSQMRSKQLVPANGANPIESKCFILGCREGMRGKGAS